MSDLTRAEFGRPGAEKHVYIGTPAHTICSNFHVSIIRAIPILLGANISVTYAHLAGHCHVDDARNLLVTDFLASGATDLLFWDADVASAPGAAARLMGMDVDIVGGAYPLKDDSGKFPVRLTGYTEPKTPYLLDAEYIPTGFMRIRRGVFEKMKEHVFTDRMDLLYTVRLDGVAATLFFERDVIVTEDHTLERIGGDANFCRRAREAGFTVWCDPSILFTHQGAVNFVGRLADAMKAEQVLAEAAQ